MTTAFVDPDQASFRRNGANYIVGHVRRVVADGSHCHMAGHDRRPTGLNDLALRGFRRVCDVDDDTEPIHLGDEVPAAIVDAAPPGRASAGGVAIGGGHLSRETESAVRRGDTIAAGRPRRFLVEPGLDAQNDRKPATCDDASHVWCGERQFHLVSRLASATRWNVSTSRPTCFTVPL